MDENFIAEAVERAGGQAAVAKLVGVSRPMVYQWVKGLRPVPPKYAPALSSASGVSRERICPGFPWADMQAAA